MTCLEHLVVNGWKRGPEISYCEASLMCGEFRESGLAAGPLPSDPSDPSQFGQDATSKAARF